MVTTERLRRRMGSENPRMRPEDRALILYAPADYTCQHAERYTADAIENSDSMRR